MHCPPPHLPLKLILREFFSISLSHILISKRCNFHVCASSVSTFINFPFSPKVTSVIWAEAIGFFIFLFQGLLFIFFMNFWRCLKEGDLILNAFFINRMIRRILKSLFMIKLLVGLRWRVACTFEHHTLLQPLLKYESAVDTVTNQQTFKLARLAV